MLPADRNDPPMVVVVDVDEQGRELLRAALGTPQFHALAQELMPVPTVPVTEGGDDDPGS